MASGLLANCEELMSDEYAGMRKEITDNVIKLVTTVLSSGQLTLKGQPAVNSNKVADTVAEILGWIECAHNNTKFKDPQDMKENFGVVVTIDLLAMVSMFTFKVVKAWERSFWKTGDWTATVTTNISTSLTLTARQNPNFYFDKSKFALIPLLNLHKEPKRTGPEKNAAQYRGRKAFVAVALQLAEEKEKNKQLSTTLVAHETLRSVKTSMKRDRSTEVE